MDKIDNSQRTAAKIAGWSGLLTSAIVVFGKYVLLDLRCNRVGLVRPLRFHFPYFPAVQQNR